jgi:hypothetical protein
MNNDLTKQMNEGKKSIQGMNKNWAKKLKSWKNENENLNKNSVEINTNRPDKAEETIPCVMTHVDSSLTHLYSGSWSPSHVNFCHFKCISSSGVGNIKHFHVLGFLPIPISHVCALPLSCDPSPTTLLHLPKM